MAETIGSDDDESEFGSVTSSQKSFLKNCLFACPKSSPTKSSDDLETTEILETPISPTVTRTPILSLSTPMSLDSINDEEVFRTPPENASLSSAAESEQHRVRVTDTKLKSDTTPENVRVLKTNRTSDSDEPVTEMSSTSQARYVAGRRGFPTHCECGLPVTIYTSKTQENPGRPFFRCPSKKDDHLFLWVEDCVHEEVEDALPKLEIVEREIRNAKSEVEELKAY